MDLKNSYLHSKLPKLSLELFNFTQLLKSIQQERFLEAHHQRTKVPSLPNYSLKAFNGSTISYITSSHPISPY